ncbi:MAG: hypothetical protein R2709_11365 [Marmoricola sp.]
MARDQRALQPARRTRCLRIDEFAAGDTTRLAIEMDAARAALRVFPDHARIGAWVFSEDQGGPGQPWKQLAPIKRLDSQENGRSHRANLLKAVDGLPAIAKGGTGLYRPPWPATRRSWPL